MSAPVILHGDCIAILAEFPESSVDAIVTDPPYGLGFMGKGWDDLPPGREWADACLRVLKPGGHLLAFGGTRTWHRLAVAIDDAGFEMRDSIAWLYGSGFPKSLDVSKAIDKAAGATREIVGVAAGAGSSNTASLGIYSPTYDATVAATPDAVKWQGWGTALKPAFEPIVVARKPLGGTINVRARVEHELRQRGVTGDIQWTDSAASAGSRLAPSEPSANPAVGSATPRSESAPAKPSAHLAESGEQTTPSEPANCPDKLTSGSAQPSLPHTDQTAPAVESPSLPSSPSTTSREVEPHTAEPSTARSTANCVASDSLPATESFAGTATGLTDSRARVLISRLADGTFVWPDDLPLAVSSGSTVAANVLAHGTGALNIDATRVTSDDDTRRNSRGGENGLTGEGTFKIRERRADEMPETSGRRPTNVLLDGDTADTLDEQTGTLTSGVLAAHHKREPKDAGILGAFDAVDGERGYGDTGGASRFFPTFRYQAKAPTRERPKVDGVAHPTVKPLELMRWLVRLVTPPGGVVLDPFAGSGTTIEAALLEGFRVIGIEREAEYLPLIQARIDRTENAA